MRYIELLKEELEIRYIDDETLYKNPSNKDLNKIINQSKVKAVRVVEDDDGNIWIWDAYRLIHSDVANELETAEEGYTLTLKDGKYPTWGDSETTNKKGFEYLNQNDNFSRMTLNKAIYDELTSLQFWSMFR